MRLLKIILSYSYELCLLDEKRYQNCGKQFIVKFKHKQANMEGNK